MAEQEIEARVFTKVDTLENWNANPLPLGPGEMALVTTPSGIPMNMKWGDKTTRKRFSDLPFAIAYDQGQFVAVSGTTLPASDGNIHYSIVGEGTYTRSGQSDVVVPAGKIGVIVDDGTTWILSSTISIPTNYKITPFVQGKTYNEYDVVSRNSDGVNGTFIATTNSVTIPPNDGSAGWERLGTKGRENTFDISASNPNLITFFGSLSDIYIIDSNDTAKAEDFLFISVWVNNSSVNSQVGAFGFQIQRLSETPINFGISKLRTTEDVIVGELTELRPVGGSANFRVFVKFKSIIPASTSFLSNPNLRILNTSALSIKNSSAAIGLIDKNTFVDPKVYPSMLVSDWFKVIKNIYIYDPDKVSTDVYAVSYVWMNDSTFGKYGMQITKNGANNSNFTIRTATPIAKGTYRLELFNASQPLKNISIVVEFSNFGTFPTTSGSVAYVHSIFTSAAFRILNDRNITNLLGANATYKLNKITVTRNANDYLSIRETIMNITDASEGNRYEVYVPDGNWFEIDIQLKKWVKLVLSDKAEIYCDSTKTDAKYTIPSGYPYPSVIGQQINSVDFSLIHTVWIKSNSQIEGKGIISVNRGKYAIHIDSNTFNEFSIEGTTLKSRTALHPVGVGIWGGQTLNFKRCVFDSDTEYGIGVHNWNNQSKSCTVNLVECKYNDCDYVKIDELGSNQIDIINIVNCTTNSIGTIRYSVTSSDGTNSYWKDSSNATTNNPLEVPYNISVNVFGTVVNEIKVGTTGWTAYPNQYTRDVYKILNTSFINGYVRCLASGTILKGELVSISNVTNSNTTVLKFLGDSSNDAYGIAIADPVGGFIWVATKGKITDTLATGVNFSVDASRKLTYSSGLVSTPTAKHYEVLAEAIEPSIGSYIRAKLK